jgi:hypothetical protein
MNDSKEMQELVERSDRTVQQREIVESRRKNRRNARPAPLWTLMLIPMLVPSDFESNKIQ